LRKTSLVSVSSDGAPQVLLFRVREPNVIVLGCPVVEGDTVFVTDGVVVGDVVNEGDRVGEIEKVGEGMVAVTGEIVTVRD